jgi:hypothetical protein
MHIVFLLTGSLASLCGKAADSALLMENITFAIRATGLPDILTDLHPDQRGKNAVMALTASQFESVLNIVSNTAFWKRDGCQSKIWHGTDWSFRLKSEPSPHVIIKHSKDAYLCSVHIDLRYSSADNKPEAFKHLTLEVAPHFFLPWTRTSQRTIAEHLANMRPLS